MFELEIEIENIKSYKLRKSNFRIVFIQVGGPLNSLSILVPTLSETNQGLPHTLEHLIFGGSNPSLYYDSEFVGKVVPSAYKRGFLDTLATRMLSTGTNAYTSLDHTCYELSTAGHQGLIETFPIFLQHILFPTLSQSLFKTEVYHIDNQGKQQGVVFNEMAARNDTEADMLDLKLRQLVYDNNNTYHYECGGLVDDISLLSNQEIIDYHKKFYHLDNITAIITGNVKPESVFKKLEEFPFLFKSSNKSESLDVKIEIEKSNSTPQIQPAKHSMVKFPSEDTEFGSIAYGWKGPTSNNFQDLLALEVLFRYFVDNASSPFMQEFVQRTDPYASDVDFEVNDAFQSLISLVFSGVPVQNNICNDGQSMQSSDDETETDEESLMSLDNAREADKVDLFQPLVFFGKVFQCFNDFVNLDENLAPEFTKLVRRHGQKFREALEESPHEVLASSIIPDLLRFAFSDKKKDSFPDIGSRLKFFDILKDLEQRPFQFWKELALNYLICNPVYEVMMIPDSELAAAKEAKKKFQENARKTELGPKLDEIKTDILAAIEENKVDLSCDDIRSMAAVPDVSKACQLFVEMENNFLANESIFSSSQIVKTETEFCHLGFCFNSTGLDRDLRPLLVIFQELFFQSPILIPNSDGGIELEMNYQQVAKKSSELFIDHSCGTGFGNSFFSASYLSQLVIIFASSSVPNFEEMIRFVAQVLMFSVFTTERILTISNNLLSSLSDVKRDGNGVLGAIVEKVSMTNVAAENLGFNDHAISIFKQEPFLKHVVKSIKNGKGEKLISDLNSIRRALIRGDGESPSFFRLGIPRDFASLNSTKDSSSAAISKDVLSIWKQEAMKYEPESSLPSKVKTPCFAFPFPRTSFSYENMEKKFTNSILTPISGLNCSYLSQFVPCDLLKSAMNEDYFPTVLLAEIISKTEGPLYTGIRGAGHAYGATLSCFLWSGQLTFELYRASEPQKALDVFYSILSELFTQQGVEKYCSLFEIETAQASIAYRWASNTDTAPSIISTCLRTSLQGFQNIEDYRMYVKHLYEVTQADIERILEKYFRQFFHPDRITILTCPAGSEAVDAMVKSFSPTIPFTVMPIKTFLEE